jgi:glucokinase
VILAGDIGGTNTRLGLFDRAGDRPRRIAIGVFPTQKFQNLQAIVSAFAADPTVNGARVGAAAFGVAGPVLGGSAQLTNVGWRVDAGEISRAFDIPRVDLLNDLQAMAHAVPVLQPSELLVLQEGVPTESGNMALIAAGTGLGEAILHRVAGRFVPVASEGGHADFAARNEREFDLVRNLLERFGHAENEQVISGMGLVNLHRTTHKGPCLGVDDLDAPDAPARISAAALERRCKGCMEALDMFVDAYGAEAGSLALRSMATSGVFLGGGIAPQILPALTNGRFTRAFGDKMPPFDQMLSKVPVKVILNKEAGLLGAAVFAASL